MRLPDKYTFNVCNANPPRNLQPDSIQVKSNKIPGADLACATSLRHRFTMVPQTHGHRPLTTRIADKYIYIYVYINKKTKNPRVSQVRPTKKPALEKPVVRPKRHPTLQVGRPTQADLKNMPNEVTKKLSLVKMMGIDMARSSRFERLE